VADPAAEPAQAAGRKQDLLSWLRRILTTVSPAPAIRLPAECVRQCLFMYAIPRPVPSALPSTIRAIKNSPTAGYRFVAKNLPVAVAQPNEAPRFYVPYCPTTYASKSSMYSLSPSALARTPRRAGEWCAGHLTTSSPDAAG
jgi:hypothetical protein